MYRLLYGFGRGLRNGFVALGALAFVGTSIGVADYFATVPGSGTTFASVVVATKHYAAMMICDFTAGESQCATVSAGALSTTVSGTVVTTIGTAENSLLSSIASATVATSANTGAPIPAGLQLVGNVGIVLPAGATKSSGSTTYTVSATTVTLPAIGSHTQNVCEISVRANATAASDVLVTLSDGTTTKNYELWVAPVASGIGVIEEIYNPCLPASGTNVAWTLSVAAVGSGGVGTADITGFSQ